MGYLKKGFSGTVKSIKENKRLFVLLIVLQLIFIVSVIGISIYFQIRIFKDAQGIIEPLQNANYDADSIEEGKPFTKDMMGIYQSYISLRQNVLVFLAALFLLYVLLNGSIWILTHCLLGNIDLKNYKRGFHAWLKHLASVALILGPFLAVSYYLLISLLQGEAIESFSNAAKILSYLLLAIYYLIILSFAFTYKRSWKTFAGSISGFLLIKDFRRLMMFLKSLLIFAINHFVVLATLGYLVYRTVDDGQSFPLLTLSSILFIIGLVVARIFWIASLKEIQNKE